MTQPVHYDVEANVAAIARALEALFARARADGAIDVDLLRPQELAIPVVLAWRRAWFTGLNEGWTPEQMMCGLAGQLASLFSGPQSAAALEYFMGALAFSVEQNLTGQSVKGEAVRATATAGGRA